VPEAAQIYIDREMDAGKTIEQIRENEKEFQEKIFAMKLIIEKKLNPAESIFFDRGILDTIAYLKLYSYSINPVIIKRTKQSSYKNDVENKQSTTYHSNGKIKEITEYIEGKKNGAWSYFYDTGKKEREENYQADKKHGAWKMWYNTAQLKLEGNYANDQKTGKWTTFHWNGNKESEGEYKNGLQEGTWTKWDENGEIIERATYFNGKRK
jgi:antitoxin component YwqK of YwqJK toxin-antitoxin module